MNRVRAYPGVMTVTKMPVWKQIVQEITKRIEDGQITPGDRAPSLREICAEWEVANATAHRVLTELRASGVVESRQGVGSVVLAPSPRSGPERAARVFRGGNMHREPSEIRSVSKMPAPDDVAGMMGLPAGTSVWRRERLSKVNGVPVAHGYSWIPLEIAELVPEVLETVPVPRGAQTLATERLGTSIGRVREQVDAGECSQEVAALLGIPAGAPVLFATCWWYDSEGRLLEVGVETRKSGMPNSYELSNP